MWKAVWAIDPFETQTRPSREMVKGLLEWTQTSKVELQPVHILSIPSGEDRGFFNSPEGMQVIEGAKKATEQYLKDLDIHMALPVKIILSEHHPVQEYVQEFLDYAEEVHSDLQIVSSHARHGLGRFVNGSFSEKLLLHSRQPVVFLSHFVGVDEEDQERPHRRAVFSTDFSDYSREAFYQFIKDAHRFQIGIDLYHVVSLPASVLTSEYGAPCVIPEEYFPSQIEWARAEAEIWAEVAKSKGVTLRITVENGGVGPNISAMVLDFAESRSANMIVMGSLSGPLKSFVMGSVARKIYRSNHYAVWMYGPNALKRREASRTKPDHLSLAQA